MWQGGNSDFGGVRTAEQPGKRSWLFYLLIFSLALNLASFGALAYLRRQEVYGAVRQKPGPRLTVPELCRSLPLKPEQCRQFQGLMPEHQKRRQGFRLGLARQQQEFWELVKQDAPSWPKIQGKIREINQVQRSMEEEAVRFCLEIQKHLQPEQRAVYLKLLERQLQPPRQGGGDPAAPGPGRPQWGNTRKNPLPGK
jgi:Spy/CpxP family protein refolding chaperone